MTKKDKDAVAVIPVREGSQRVIDKNFREFVDDKSLLELKIEQLKSENCFNKIFISSDSDKARKIAEEQNIEFLDRDSELCGNDVRWSQVIYGVADSIPGENPIVAWVHTTSPLHTRYAKPLEEFSQQTPKHDSLVAVSIFQEFLVNKNGRPVNYHWGVWHDYSQDLEKLYRVTGSLFIARKKDIMHWKYLIGIKPMLYVVDKLSSVDVDTPDDFEMAQIMYKGRNSK